METSIRIKNGHYTSQELEFAIFCIESLATKLKIDAPKVYDALAEKSDILDGYIIPEYEILRTQGKDYIINDIIEIMNEKGIKI